MITCSGTATSTEVSVLPLACPKRSLKAGRFSSLSPATVASLAVFVCSPFLVTTSVNLADSILSLVESTATSEVFSSGLTGVFIFFAFSPAGATCPSELVVVLKNELSPLYVDTVTFFEIGFCALSTNGMFSAV